MFVQYLVYPLFIIVVHSVGFGFMYLMIIVNASPW